jgi:hypothetical protein
MYNKSFFCPLHENSPPTTINNCDFGTSWGDLADLFYVVSSYYESELTSASTRQDADSMGVIDNELGNNMDSRIKKVDSYPNICTNNLHLAHYQVSVIIVGASGATNVRRI